MFPLDSCTEDALENPLTILDNFALSSGPELGVVVNADCTVLAIGVSPLASVVLSDDKSLAACFSEETAVLQFFAGTIKYLGSQSYL